MLPDPIGRRSCGRRKWQGCCAETSTFWDWGSVLLPWYQLSHEHELPWSRFWSSFRRRLFVLPGGGQGPCTSMRPRDNVTDKCARVRGHEVLWDIGSWDFAGTQRWPLSHRQTQEHSVPKTHQTTFNLPFFTILRTARSSYQRYLHKLSFAGRKPIYHPLHSSNMYRLPLELLREVFDYIDDD